MIVGKHPDGRIVVLAREHGLKPMERVQQGGKSVWKLCDLTGEELNEFVSVSAADAAALLSEAKREAPFAQRVAVGGYAAFHASAPGSESFAQPLFAPDKS